MRDKHTLMIVRDEKVIGELEALFRNIEPRQVMEQLMEMQESERFQIQIQETKGGMIQVTVESPEENKRYIALVDAETKLLTCFKIYLIAEGRAKLGDRFDILDYDVKQDDSLFVLEDLPEDTLVIDRARPDVGLSQGDKSDEEIAGQLARQVITALMIDYDFEKAGLLMGGIPASFFEKRFPEEKRSQMKVTILSIGQPVPDGKTGALKVPVEIRMEMGGQEQIVTKEPYVRRMPGRPGQWTVVGGL
jgi:hypothetical protein